LGANLVEIDLVLQGQPMLDYSRENLPDWNYCVTVTRATRPDRYEIWTTTMQKELVRFKLPLAAEDYTVVDLRTLFTRAYEQGGFAGKIDYKRDPPTVLTDENRQWVGDLLKQNNLR